MTAKESLEPVSKPWIVVYDTLAASKSTSKATKSRPKVD